MTSRADFSLILYSRIACTSAMSSFVKWDQKFRKYGQNFIYARKLDVAFTIPIFTKLVITERHFYVLMHPNVTRNREIAGISERTRTALCKVLRPLHGLRRKSHFP